ncbi:DUF1684 domain-containing protein [Fodinicola feengrottensis]|uniref:DUF1684 domain-containing protein n=1 Tax=Fodinicola feengrottensis TaxID=435914 RepID=A0ABN2GRI4_9ACTN|nr:DUF1684 domain-containing protein [Fodinicola feengrottensis]
MAALPDSDVSDLALLDWRRRVAELYAAVRAAKNPADGHALWRAGRDELFQRHSQSPLTDDHPMRETGVPYWPYDPSLRFELDLLLVDDATTLDVPTDGEGTTTMRRIGQVELLGSRVDVWWLRQYAGGVFLPLRDGTAADTSYGGGRYLLDTAKSADLGGGAKSLVVDLNFLYHPSCRYNPAWQCPLAPPGNRVSFAVQAGERL